VFIARSGVPARLPSVPLCPNDGRPFRGRPEGWHVRVLGTECRGDWASSCSYRVVCSIASHPPFSGRNEVLPRATGTDVCNRSSLVAPKLVPVARMASCVWGLLLSVSRGSLAHHSAIIVDTRDMASCSRWHEQGLAVHTPADEPVMYEELLGMVRATWMSLSALCSARHTRNSIQTTLGLS